MIRTLGTAFVAFVTAAGLHLCPATAGEDGSRNTLAYYDPHLVGTIRAYAPLFSDDIPRSGNEADAPRDFVERFRTPDDGRVRVLVKAPAAAQPWRVLRVDPITPTNSANAYFAAAIDAAISGGYAKVVFPPAVYDFVAPDPSSASHLSIKGARDLVIDGQGSTLNFASPLSAGVTISDSQRVVFRGFTIDWPNTLMASVGTIVSIDKTTNPRTMRVRIGAQYPVDANTQIIALTPWDATTDPGTPHFALKDFQKEEYTENVGTVYEGGHVFQVPYYNPAIAVGDIVLVRHFGGSPYKNAVQTGGSYDINFEQVHVHASPYLAFLLSGGGGYRLAHCSVTRRDPARLISSSADAVHVADNTGDIVIEDSVFGFQGDDGLNIHGAVAGTAQPGQNALHWTVGGEGSYAPYGWVAGDPIGFFDTLLGFYGATRFQSLSHDASGLQIHLADAAPPDVTQIGDLARVSARFVVRRNAFLYNRARGILLESSFGLIERNYFTGQTLQGVVVGADSGSEGPGAQDIVFRGNHFANVGSFPTTPSPSRQHAPNGALLVAVQDAAGNVTSSRPVHQNIIFDRNVFRDLQGPGLFLSTANNVVVVDNRFIDTNLSRLPPATIGTASLAGSIVVTHAHNAFIAGNAMRGATTGPVSIDTTSTDGITH